jgi:hypothetical protein|tara:strand:+ start:1178 stop:1321 length:144 start_codon:yes stop_codon:yes gene_type:complete
MKKGDLVRLISAKKYGIIVSNLGHDRFNVMWYHGKIVPYSSDFMVKV